ncbi:MAG: lytic murein transglycosylase [Candidatus Neomarinimicrobiota bacterium]|nr:lytic murein transglycosylase [Candidatus Neomarinimicrobiota bacterium]MEC9274619.1 lytic murein transglycosylase [Candidatus Neomarinimicrobiota bacterium]
MLLFTFYLIVFMFLVGDEKVQLDTVLNDPAFQTVWNHLEKKDVPKEYVIKTFLNSEIKIHPKIINSFNNPYEKKEWEQYRKIFITEKRIKGGMNFFYDNKDLIEQVSDSLKVDKFLLVSLIGVESNYGKHYGQYSVFNALYTLIHQLPRKKKWAAKELSEFIILCHGNKINPHSIKGSYAGAFGFGQFIPSSFNYYAIDFDGDKIRHHNKWPDVLGSVANYLLKNGYKPNTNDYSKSSSAWKSVFAYNRSNNYVGVIMELRQEIKKGLFNN